MDLHPDYLNRVRQAAIKAESLGLIYLSERKEVRYRRGHLNTFLWLPKGKDEGYFIFVLSVVTKGKGRGVQDRSTLYFLWFSKGKERGTGRVIFVLSVVTKGKGRRVQCRSFLYFLWLPKGKEEGYMTGCLCTFCFYQREGYRTGHLFTFCSLQRVKKNGTGQVIFILSVVFKGKGRGVQDRSSLYFWGYQRERKRGTG